MEPSPNILDQLNDFYWEYIGVWLLMGVGFYFTLKTRFFQFQVIRNLPSAIRSLALRPSDGNVGILPIKTLFSSVGSMVGVGNIVAITAALQIGGPGALFWLWIASLLGTILKYTEAYIGIRYRRSVGPQGYEGSLMYAFPSAFQNKYWPPLGKWLALLCALLLCIYGIEVYQFTVVVDTFVRCLAVENRDGVTFSLLALIIYVGMGGTKRLSNVCTVVMPVMILLYVGVCLWILLSHFSQLPHLLWLILRSAFCGHAPLGGFIGSTLLMAIQQGVAQGVYSSDIAVGFDSVLHSESRATDPRRQACVAIIASLTDTVMCTCSFVVVLLSDLWQEGTALSASDCILKAFEAHFKWGPHFLSIIIFLAGLTTIQAYFVVGLKSASYLNPKWGKSVYFVVGILNLWIFSHCQQSHVLTLMRLASGLLILVNLICLFRLRNQVYYDLDGVFKKMEEGPDRT